MVEGYVNRETTSNKITAILPAFNEEISIGSVILWTKEYVDRVIVVDDGSSDHTADVAMLAGAEVICHLTNMGKGAALKTGFEVVADTDVILTIDSDGQHNPCEIPTLIALILKGDADLVIGSRYMNGNEKNTPAYRRLGQFVLNQVTNLNSGLHVTDTQSGFRAFAGSTKNLFRFNSSGLAIESEMLADAGNAGLRIKEVEVGVRYDVDCSTENPVKHGVGVLVKVLRDMEFRKPLYYFTVPGIIIGIGGLQMGLIFLQIFYRGGSLQFGPTILMMILMLTGMFMAFTGIILHSMARMIQEAKNLN